MHQNLLCNRDCGTGSNQLQRIRRTCSLVATNSGVSTDHAGKLRFNRGSAPQIQTASFRTVQVTASSAMSRQLRPRKNRPKYALADLGTDDENQSQDNDKTSPIDDIRGNESDFTPNKKKRKAREEDNDDDDDDDSDDDDMSDDVSQVDRINQTRQPRKSSLKKEQRRSKSTGKGPSRQKRTSHRAVSLFSRSGRVERLDEPPKIFQPTSTTLTTASIDEIKVADRVSRSWGYNVGPGPLWELIEDKGWFKEAAPTGETEAHRRPRVYQDVRVREGWEVLSEA